MAAGFAVCALWRLALPARTIVFEFVYIAFCPHAAAVNSAQSSVAPRSISADMIAAWGMSRCAIRDRFSRPRSSIFSASTVAERVGSLLAGSGEIPNQELPHATSYNVVHSMASHATRLIPCVHYMYLRSRVVSEIGF